MNDRLGATWAEVDFLAQQIAELVWLLVPNRYEELLGNAWRYRGPRFRYRWQPEPIRDSAFGVVVANERFLGHSDVSTCPTCGTGCDLTLLDARFILLLRQARLLIHGFIDPSQNSCLAFHKPDESGQAAARHLIKWTFEEDRPAAVIPGLYVNDALEPHSFLSAVSDLAILWTAIHETSHTGPGARGADFYLPRLAALAPFASKHKIPPRRHHAWADELTTDINAFAMAETEMFDRLGSERGSPKHGWHDAALLAGAVFSVAMLMIVLWYMIPSDQGAPYRSQAATVRHPPAYLRINSLIEHFYVGVAQGLYADSPWKDSAFRLSMFAFRLFGLPVRFESRDGTSDQGPG